MINNIKSHNIIRLISDIIFLSLAFYFAISYSQSISIFLNKPFIIILLPLLAILWLFSSTTTKTLEAEINFSFFQNISYLAKNCLLQFSFVIVYLFFIKEDLFTRNFILSYNISLFFLISLNSFLIIPFVTKKIFNSSNTIKYIIIGNNNLSRDFKKHLEENFQVYNFCGFIDDTNDVENIGSIESLERIIDSMKIQNIIVALPVEKSDKIDKILHIADCHSVKCFILPEYIKFINNKVSINLLGNYPVISVRNNPLENFQIRVFKRIFDLLFSFLILLTIFSWLVPIISILIKFSSPGPVFFIQKRIGRNGKLFRCFKFRTMTVKSSQYDIKYEATIEKDTRVTKIGTFLRKTNLDEFPQFINVFLGSMSVVGPRPHAIAFDENYSEIVEEIKLRNRVKPGITGWAQINGLRGDVADPVENSKRIKERIKSDIWYIDNYSFLLDIQIIITTITQIIKRQNKGL